jgi:hypothetical protein
VESGKAYLDTLHDQVLTHGRPLAFYSDRHGIFRVNAENGKTEFGRVMERLEIGLINALTPQAKGRAERANQTLPTCWHAGTKYCVKTSGPRTGPAVHPGPGANEAVVGEGGLRRLA